MVKHSFVGYHQQKQQMNVEVETLNDPILKDNMIVIVRDF